MLPQLIVLAAGYGALAGLFVPRAVYRMAVEPQEPWRAACPAGHVLTGVARGWLGLPRCGPCADAGPGAGAAPETTRPLGHGTRPATATPCSAAVSTPRYGSGAGARYGPRATLTAAGAALVCAALTAAAGARPELAVWLLLVPFLLVLALVDRAVHRLPDVLTLTLPAAAAALLGAVALLPGHTGSWPRALLGGLALGGVYLVLFLIHPSGMGFGDVKLALTLGIVLGWYGWPVLAAGAFAGLLFGACYGAGLLLTRRAGRRTALPFGPFMVSGTLLGLLLNGLGAA